MPRRILTQKGKAFRLEGLPELQQKVNGILARTGYLNSQKIGEEIKHVLMGAALVVRDEARDLAPVKSGALRDAIFANYGDPGKPDVLIGVNYRRAPHAHLVEFGTVHSQPHPYMRPAIQATRAAAARIVSEGIQSVIERWGK